MLLNNAHETGAMPNKNGIDGRKEDSIKKQSARKHRQKQIRQAKSFVISIMGDLFKTCQSNEARKLYRLAQCGLSPNVLLEVY